VDTAKTIHETANRHFIEEGALKVDRERVVKAIRSNQIMSL
jgi:anti-sigma28 factor (negative regulator of flagellin synthesis)